jgi:dCMP deaminase
MFIGVLGSACAGKGTVVDYLTSRGFLELGISSSSESTSRLELAEGQHAASSSRQVFQSATSLLDFVTRDWRANYVALLNGNDAALLEISVRPFFLVLIVDAPVLLRWRRLQLVGSTVMGRD